MKPPRLFALVPIVAVVGCLDVADDRARRDGQVGQAQHVTGASVRIDSGAAAVRAFGPRGVTLWAGAPQLSGQLVTAGQGGGFEFRIRNRLPDAQLVVVDSAGSRLPVTAIPTEVPTEGAWSIDAPAMASLVFALQASDSDVVAPWRFAVFADVQEAIDEFGSFVDRMNATPGLRFALVSGDLTERGTDDELAAFERATARLKVPWYATLGNHELGTREYAFHDFFGRGNHHFAFRGLHVTMLDSASATIAPAVYDWLDGWLGQGAGALHVALMHIPPSDPVGTRGGSFASRSEASRLLTKLARGGVDLTVYGHVHSYYAYTNAGIPAFITGGGGAIPERFDRIDRHFLTVDVDPVRSTLDVGLVRVD